MNLKAITIGAIALAGAWSPAFAGANLVTNGGFENFSQGGPDYFTNIGVATATDWAINSYAAIYSPGAADTGGAFQGPGGSPSGYVTLWGPGNGVPNGLPATSPAGGNYLAIDGDPTFGAYASQTINGLKSGEKYTLTFYWAAAQWRNSNATLWNGATYEQLNVFLGAQEDQTGVLSIASHGFSGWESETLSFTATGASELLNFVTNGGPAGGGMPPVALLDGVSLTGVPEPTTWAMMVLGFIGLGYAGFRSNRRKAAAIA